MGQHIYNPGALNRRIQIYTQSTFTDEDEWDKLTHENVATTWAYIRPVRGREYLEQDVDRNDNPVVICIRYRRDVDEGCKIVYQGKVYRVKSIADSEEWHEKMILYCTEWKRGKTTPAIDDSTIDGDDRDTTNDTTSDTTRWIP